MIRYLFIFALSLSRACTSDGSSAPETDTIQTNSTEISGQASNTRMPEMEAPQDTLYRISGTEPFWSLIIARPAGIFTSMGGDTLRFPYQQPLQAGGRQEDYVQVFNLGDQQKVILKRTGNCPCSDGMSNREYPYEAILVLSDKVLEGCADRGGD